MGDYEVFHDSMIDLINAIPMEEKAVITDEFRDISSNDMRIIEAIGLKDPRSMSAVAKDLSVTVGTLTIAINNLVKKSYVKRTRSELDRRVVLVSLLDKGVRAYNHRHAFHEAMIDAILEDMDEEQTEVLARAVSNLRTFYKNYGK